MNFQSKLGAAFVAAGGLILSGLALILFSGSDLGFVIALQIGFVGVVAAFLAGLAGVVGGLSVAVAGALHPQAYVRRAPGLQPAHCR
jgi:hypothetical protein